MNPTSASQQQAPLPVALARREAAVDVARGAAMFFVCLSHFAQSYVLASGDRRTAAVLYGISMIASPSFVFVSGALLGVFFATRRESFVRFRIKLADRALFLLLVGHLLLYGTSLPAPFDLERMAHVYVTDAIAIAILVVPLLLPSIAPSRRLTIAAAMLLGSWAAAAAFEPESRWARILMDMVVGTRLHGELASFPVIPWMAVYLASTVVGERLGRQFLRDEHRAAALGLARIGMAAVACALIVRAMRVPLLAAAGHGPSREVVVDTTSVWQKSPLSPAYILFFGGLALCVIALTIELWRSGRLPRLTRWLEHVGKATFFVYVFQAYIYFLFLRLVHLPGTALWPVVFLATLVPIALAARAWSARNGNRLLTVGLAALARHRATLRDPH